MKKTTINKPQPIKSAKAQTKRCTKKATARLTIEEMKDIETAIHDRIVAEIARKMFTEGTKRQTKKSKKAS